MNYEFTGLHKKIVQKDSRLPVAIAVSANYDIFQQNALEIDCNVIYGAYSAVLVKPDIIQVTFGNK